MNASKTSATEYMLLGFVFSVDETGKPLMRTSRCGSFASADEAFDVARELVNIQWRVVAEKSAGDPNAKVLRIAPTEWGYDLVCGTLVVQRFWVHDNNATEVFAS